MQNKTIKVLFIEDSATDAEWAERALLESESTKYLLKWAPSLETGKANLKSETFDVILCD